MSDNSDEVSQAKMRRPLSIVILYFRSPDTIRSTVQAVMEQVREQDEIILVDNASKDGVCASLVSHFEDVRLVELPVNVGYAGGMNRGAALAKPGNDLLFLTHEVALEHGCIDALRSALARQNNSGVVAPRLALQGTQSAWSAGGTVTAAGAARHTTDESCAPIQWVDGACLLVARKDWEHLQGFDERFFLYWEDVDFGYRLAPQRPLKVVSTARASQATGTIPVYYGARNRLLMWRIHRRPIRVFLTVLWICAKLLLSDAPRRSGARARARLAGLWDGFSGSLRPELGAVRES